MAGRIVCIAVGQMRLMDCNAISWNLQTHTSRRASQSLGNRNRNPTSRDCLNRRRVRAGWASQRPCYEGELVGSITIAPEKCTFNEMAHMLF